MGRDILADLFDEDDDDFEDSKPDTGKNDLPKTLRSKIKDLQDELKTLRAENAVFKAEQTKTTLASILEKQGYKPSLAKFVAKDLDEVTEESVVAWLDENGDLFAGARIDTQQTSEAKDSSSPDRAAQQRMARLEQDLESRTVNVAADLEDRIQSAKSMDELMQILRSSGV